MHWWFCVLSSHNLYNVILVYGGENNKYEVLIAGAQVQF